MKNRLPERLKQIRGPLSQVQISRKLDIPQNTYSRYETGTSEPPLDLLCKFSEFFGVSSDWLLGLSDERLASGNTAISSGHSVSAINSSVAVPNGAEVERLRGEVAALERALRMFAGRGRDV